MPKKKDTDSFKLENPADGSTTHRPAQDPRSLSHDHDPERDLGAEPSLFSGTHELAKLGSAGTADPALTQELKEQIDWLHGQVKDISNLRGGEKLTADQTEILRRYLSLKESEVRDLREQRQQYQQFVGRLSSELEKANLRIRELLTDMETVRSQDEVNRKELRGLKDEKEAEILRLRADYEAKLKKTGAYEFQVEDLIKRRDQWREKIKEELKRIKLKERELENRYELLKRDMQALLDSKDKHALELKKKNDALELEMESLEEKLLLSSRRLASVESKKRRLVETLRLAGVLLESIDQDEASLDRENQNDDAPPEGDSKGSRKAG